jgi:hypothetical protein
VHESDARPRLRVSYAFSKWSLDVAIDERAKERERVPSNVGPFFPRTATSASKTQQSWGPRGRGRNVVDNDEDPGPSAA